MSFNGGFWMMNIEGGGDCGGSVDDDGVDGWGQWWWWWFVTSERKMWFWICFLFLSFSASVVQFSIFRSPFHSTSTSIYSSNAVAMRLCECVCKNFKFHQLSEAIVWETWTYYQFFKLCLLKLHLFAPKGYTIALQSEEKNGCVFNALEKN
jgi:hypothetical protein